MPEPVLNILMDQNVPVAAVDWLRSAADWPDSLIIVDNRKIRVRRGI